MSITDNDIQKAFRIKRAVTEFFRVNSMTKIEAKELMPFFISKDIFKSNNKDGLPIRDFLRHLEAEKYLYLIPQTHYIQKDRNMFWYFIK